MKQNTDKLVDVCFERIKQNTHQCNSNNRTRVCNCSHIRSCKYKKK